MNEIGELEKKILELKEKIAEEDKKLGDISERREKIQTSYLVLQTSIHEMGITSLINQNTLTT